MVRIKSVSERKREERFSLVLLTDAVRLRKGENTILVKSAVSAERMSSGRQFGFTLRLTDENGNTLTNILN